MMYHTLTEACRDWVKEFNAIPMSVIEKLYAANKNDFMEVTPPSVYDRIYICSGKWQNNHGEIVKTCYHGDEDKYLVKIDGDSNHIIEKDDFEIEKDYCFPIWGTMWAFDNVCDHGWLEGEYGESGLQKMADCGFRIYESEDYGYVFGIDGAGYDFFTEHWIPLYKARGLKWHEVDDTKEKKPA